MNVWLPYVVGGSGTDTFTRSFASRLEAAGHSAFLQAFPHWMQFAPDLLRTVKPPKHANVTLTNTWNGFAFERRGVPMVTMEQLCVFDRAYESFRSAGQALFHLTLVRWFETRTFAAADRVVAVSRATQRAVMESFEGVAPIVIPNGVDTDFFSPGPAKGNDGVFRLLFVGNLTTRKGADLLPGIMNALGPGFFLRYTTGLRKRAVLDAENAVSLGSLDLNGVRQAYREADALIFPTRLEGLPLSVLEAMACGLPVVGSDRSSMSEAVADGQTGFLCALEAGAFVSAIRSLAENQTLRTKMGEAARRRAASEFSIDLTVQRYLELFRELVD